jgi:hypothetical protein
MITKQQVIAVLAEQRVNRPRHLADANIRRLLHQYGGGATNINELNPELYESVWRAAGGFICSAEDRYGTVTDVQPIPASVTVAREPWDVIEDAAPAPSRTRTALVAELEARLKERAGKPRQAPQGRVDTGAPSQFGDQDDSAVRDFPAGERVS